MMALMHQNMGKLEYETSVAFSLRGQQFHVSAMKHLNQSLKQLNASTEIFENLYTLSSMDTSTAMEYIYGLQLFAGVSCDAAGNLQSQNKYENPLALWNKAISSARSSLHGLTMGIQYENFPVVLYNAAICFNSGERWQAAKKLLNESITIMEGIKSQQLGQADTVLPKYKDIYENARIVLQSLQTKSSRLETSHELVETSSSSTANPDRVLQVVLPSGEKKTYTVASSESGQDGIGLGEWVECDEADLNCEVFEVYDDEPNDDIISKDVQRSPSLNTTQYSDNIAPVAIDINTSLPHVSIPVSAKGDDSAMIDDPSMYDGLDEEEIEELRYTRERYTRLASQHRSDGGGELAELQQQYNNDPSVARPEASASDVEQMGSSNEVKNLNDEALKKSIQAIEKKLDNIMQELQNLKVQLTHIHNVHSLRSFANLLSTIFFQDELKRIHI